MLKFWVWIEAVCCHDAIPSVCLAVALAACLSLFLRRCVFGRVCSLCRFMVLKRVRFISPLSLRFHHVLRACLQMRKGIRLFKHFFPEAAVSPTTGNKTLHTFRFVFAVSVTSATSGACADLTLFLPRRSSAVHLDLHLCFFGECDWLLSVFFRADWFVCRNRPCGRVGPGGKRAEREPPCVKRSLRSLPGRSLCRRR